MLQHWIWLSTRKSLSDKWKVSLLEHFHDPEQIYFAGGQDFSFVDFLTAEAVESLMDRGGEDFGAVCRLQDPGDDLFR